MLDMTKQELKEILKCLEFRKSAIEASKSKKAAQELYKIDNLIEVIEMDLEYK